MQSSRTTSNPTTLNSAMSILHPPSASGRRGYLQVLALNTSFHLEKPPHTKSVAAMSFLAGPHGAAIERILARYPYLGWHSAVIAERTNRRGHRVLIYHIGADELDHRDWFWLFLELRRYVRRCWPYGEFRIEARVADVESFVRDHRRGLVEEFPSMEYWGEIGDCSGVSDDDRRAVGQGDAVGQETENLESDRAEIDRMPTESGEEEVQKQAKEQTDDGNQQAKHEQRECEHEPATGRASQQEDVAERRSVHQQIRRRVSLFRKLCTEKKQKGFKKSILGLKRKLSWLGPSRKPEACPMES